MVPITLRMCNMCWILKTKAIRPLSLLWLARLYWDSLFGALTRLVFFFLFCFFVIYVNHIRRTAFPLSQSDG